MHFFRMLTLINFCLTSINKKITVRNNKVPYCIAEAVYHSIADSRIAVHAGRECLPKSVTKICPDRCGQFKGSRVVTVNWLIFEQIFVKWR